MSTLKTIASQYQSALKMLGSAIQLCPEDLWLAASTSSPNRFWHIAYHTLYYTHFYLAPSDADFLPWSKGRPEAHFLGAVPWRPNEVHIETTAFTRAELLEYLELCQREVEMQVYALNLDAPSGFYWLSFQKLELQFYNIRHIAHHTGQLAERLRTQANIGLPWVG